MFIWHKNSCFRRSRSAQLSSLGTVCQSNYSALVPDLFCSNLTQKLSNSAPLLFVRIFLFVCLFSLIRLHIKEYLMLESNLKTTCD